MNTEMQTNHLTKITFILLTFLVFISIFGRAEPVYAEQNTVNIYVFVGEGCPYCAKTLHFLHEFAEKDSRLVVHEFEVYNSLENREYFIAFADRHGFEPQYVPTTFLGERFWVGFSNTIQAEMENAILECLEKTCIDFGREILPATAFPETHNPADILAPGEDTPILDDEQFSIVLPIIGTINLADKSILLSTILIAIVDGFNPCSIWVLSMLLAITLNTRSRKKVFLIGFVFIFVTALVYALFIGGLFTVFTFIGFVGWIQKIVALVAIGFAVINIKDYFWYKEGVSLTISEKKKPGIYKGIRKIMNAEDNIWALISATIVLAIGVSLVEFTCTAGFPMIWTNLLATQEIAGLAFLGLLLVYMTIYQLDEMGIFLVAVLTLRKNKMEEKYGRLLKLLGGMLMLALGLVMWINPTLMTNIGSSLWVFGAAFGLTGLVLLIHRVVLPKFHISIGSKK